MKQRCGATIFQLPSGFTEWELPENLGRAHNVKPHFVATIFPANSFYPYIRSVSKPMRGTMWKVTPGRRCEGVLWTNHLASNFLCHPDGRVWKSKHGLDGKCEMLNSGKTHCGENIFQLARDFSQSPPFLKP